MHSHDMYRYIQSFHEFHTPIHPYTFINIISISQGHCLRDGQTLMLHSVLVGTRLIAPYATMAKGQKGHEGHGSVLCTRSGLPCFFPFRLDACMEDFKTGTIE